MEAMKIEANKVEASKPMPAVAKNQPPKMAMHSEHSEKSEKTAATQPNKQSTEVTAKTTSGSKEGVESATTTSHDWVSDIREQAEDMDQMVRGFIAKNPAAAVAITVGIGFVGSLIMKKLNSGKDA